MIKVKIPEQKYYQNQGSNVSNTKTNQNDQKHGGIGIQSVPVVNNQV